MTACCWWLAARGARADTGSVDVGADTEARRLAIFAGVGFLAEFALALAPYILIRYVIRRRGMEASGAVITSACAFVAGTILVFLLGLQGYSQAAVTCAAPVGFKVLVGKGRRPTRIETRRSAEGGRDA